MALGGWARGGLAGSGGRQSAMEKHDGDEIGQQSNDVVEYIASGCGLGESIGVASRCALLLRIKRKNFQSEEEKQLTKSVLAIS